ncbi:MAG TPA: ribonuclease E/G [Magnetospirillaceae bacterium]|jgi:ribonuclease E
MVKRMLIDATHAEETRVVVLNGSRLEEFDVETSTKKQLKGNIYLAKIVRVEPSLQAAFVDYGGGRHGFLAFNEIHPDYYQIPVADRQALIAEHRAQMRSSGAAASADFDDSDGEDHGSPAPAAAAEGEVASSEQPLAEGAETPTEGAGSEGADAAAHAEGEESDEAHHDHEASDDSAEAGEHAHDGEAHDHEHDHDHGEDAHEDDHAEPVEAAGGSEPTEAGDAHGDHSDGVPHTVAAAATVVQIAAPIETVDLGGGDDVEEVEEVVQQRRRPLRHYKIQEVIKRRQIVLVQVVKEERGTKGAALTTFLSLAGRYCVLMPNTARGGGVSRKITNATDRKRLKGIVNELEIPDGMAVIIRTAGSERTKPEIKRDYEYLLRLWDSVRELTLQSTAPALVYEEANLIKRSIRDLYARDIDEILVEGDEGYRLAKDFMRMLTPSHAKKVQLYKDPAIPMLHRFQVEQQLDAMHSPTVQLKSGGYIVINQTEALVAIDVNSGRATRERHIEETAYKTNLEAADEIARQLRLRDLAGLIVIDFIDMEESRNNHAVERRIKDAMRLDRARIQLGRISPFGLLELSRQRLRPSLMESSFQLCSHCGGTGSVRSVESSAVHILRVIEEEGIRRRGGEIRVTVHTDIALYLLNQKRAALLDFESRYLLRVLVAGDGTLIPPTHRLERLRNEIPPDLLARPAPVHMESGLVDQPVEEEIVEDEAIEETEETEGEEITASEGSEEGRAASDDRPHDGPRDSDRNDDGDASGRRRRRRRRRGRRDGRDGHEGGEHRTQLDNAIQGAEIAAGPEMDGAEDGSAEAPMSDEGAPQAEGNGTGENGEHGPRRRRRGKRGGRRRNRVREGEAQQPQLRGPGHDLAPDHPFAVADIDHDDDSFGPGEAGEADGDEPDASHDIPAQDHDRSHDDAEADRQPERSTRSERAEPETHTAEAKPAPAEPPAPAPVPAPKAAEPARAPEPAPEQPASPPRRGWWNRVI